MQFDVKEYYDEQRARAEEKSDTEQSMIRHVSRSLIKGEAALQVARMFYCQLAGDDRRGEDAQAQAIVEGAIATIMSAHAELSVLAAKRDKWDIPGEGGR